MIKSLLITTAIFIGAIALVCILGWTITTYPWMGAVWIGGGVFMVLFVIIHANMS